MKAQIMGDVIRTKFGDFVCPPKETYVRGEMLEQGVFAEEEIRRLRGFVRDPDTTEILIVGAHIGAIAIPMSRHCHHLTAVEANPDTFPYLQMNVALNRCYNVDLLYGAANDTGGGTLKFWKGRNNSGASKRKPVAVDKPRYVLDTVAEVDVPTVRLDDVYPDTVFDVIHMDIEGSEPFALKGMENILQRNNVLSIEFVWHHLPDVAGVTAEQWLEPIRAGGYKELIVTGRPWMIVKPADWTCGIETLLKMEAMFPAIYFIKERPAWLRDAQDTDDAKTAPVTGD